MLFDALRQVVADTLGPLVYRDGTLTRTGYVDNGKGTMAKTEGGPYFIKVQVDEFAQRQRPEGWAEDDVRLIVLEVPGVPLPENRLKDDDLITVEGCTYAIIAPTRDPLKTHWTCRGRAKPSD